MKRTLLGSWLMFVASHAFAFAMATHVSAVHVSPVHVAEVAPHVTEVAPSVHVTEEAPVASPALNPALMVHPSSNSATFALDNSAASDAGAAASAAYASWVAADNGQSKTLFDPQFALWFGVGVMGFACIVIPIIFSRSR